MRFLLHALSSTGRRYCVPRHPVLKVLVTDFAGSAKGRAALRSVKGTITVVVVTVLTVIRGNWRAGRAAWLGAVGSQRLREPGSR